MLPPVEYAQIPLRSIVPAGYNPRKISARARSGLRASLRKFGLVQPIVVNRREDGELRIVGGHQRVDELLTAGIEEVQVAFVQLGDKDERALNLALNNPDITGEWVPDMLGELLEGLQEDDPQLFADLCLDGLFAEAERAAKAGQGDPEETPEPPAIVTSLPGDVWRLGRHRIVCGDSTDATTVARLLGDVKPHLMVTDPPYGVDYDPAWRNSRDTARGMKIAPAQGKVDNDHRADWREAWALFPGDVAYVWHAPGELQISVGESLKAAGFECRNHIIWAKHALVLGRGHYHQQHEPCWYAVRKGATGHWNGDRKQSTLWTIPGWTFGGGKRGAENEGTGHGTQKPVECMKRPIENNSNPGQAVYEPFSGSGTTIIAGEMTGRHVYAVELNPAYVDVAVLRWQKFTGQPATLEGDGRTFDEVAATRKEPR